VGGSYCVGLAGSVGCILPRIEAAGTSQICPECDSHVSKNLSIRVHECPECWYKTDRVAAAQVIRNRGFAVSAQPNGICAAGQTVDEIACQRDASGAGLSCLDGTGCSRKILAAMLGSAHQIKDYGGEDVTFTQPKRPSIL
jgi:putative transposase